MDMFLNVHQKYDFFIQWKFRNVHSTHHIDFKFGSGVGMVIKIPMKLRKWRF